MEQINLILNILGLILSLGGAILILNLLKNWKGEMQDGITLFLWGFFITSLAFIWTIFGAEQITFISSQSIFLIGTVSLTAGAYRLFTLV